jgi:hypothetical protein
VGDNRGKPQPASQAMTRNQAEAVERRTHGQMRAFEGDDGQWYLQETRQDPPTRDSAS